MIFSTKIIKNMFKTANSTKLIVKMLNVIKFSLKKILKIMKKTANSIKLIANGVKNNFYKNITMIIF